MDYRYDEYVCIVCKLSFSSRLLLNMHLDMHLGGEIAAHTAATESR